MIGQGAVVGKLATFLQDGSHDATEGLPGRMVVDLGRGSRRADEHFQRVVMLGAVVALGNIPVLGPSHLPKERGRKSDGDPVPSRDFSPECVKERFSEFATSNAQVTVKITHL
jgi:hypothetical protein